MLCPMLLCIFRSYTRKLKKMNNKYNIVNSILLNSNTCNMCNDNKVKSG